ncbi:MAG: COX15/CtaA family protein [Marinovum sp.]|nr:COX15/CtaA family protein [Marinovum sp.]
MSKKRAIFEDVAADAPRATPAETGSIDRGRGGARKAIVVWLAVLFALVVLMVFVGGLTRLTDSGLSITEWAPLSGAIPPLTAEDWAAEFERYRQIPEYQLQNQGMTLGEFKFIYWWEWGHRQLGRVIGLVWALGFLWLLLTRSMPRGRDGLWIPIAGFAGFFALIGAEVALRQGAITEQLVRSVEGYILLYMGAIVAVGAMAKSMDWTAKLLFLGLMGGLQGAIGWWMVSSGLDGSMLDVASYRLATHLGLAFIILGFITWYILLLLRPERDLLQARRDGERKLFGMSTGLLHLSFVQILLGALVAGIDAGQYYSEWPLMGGQIFPPTAFDLEPLWRNFLENEGLVQFIHRTVGYLVAIFGIVVWLRARRSPHRSTRFAFNAVLAMMVLQTTIGILTVLYGASWQVAIVHQFGAVVFWVLILRARFLAAYPKFESVRGTT